MSGGGGGSGNGGGGGPPGGGDPGMSYSAPSAPEPDRGGGPQQTYEAGISYTAPEPAAVMTVAGPMEYLQPTDQPMDHAAAVAAMTQPEAYDIPEPVTTPHTIQDEIDRINTLDETTSFDKYTLEHLNAVQEQREKLPPGTKTLETIMPTTWAENTGDHPVYGKNAADKYYTHMASKAFKGWWEPSTESGMNLINEKKLEIIESQGATETLAAIYDREVAKGTREESDFITSDINKAKEIANIPQNITLEGAEPEVTTDDRDFEEQSVGTPFENIYEGPAVDVATIHGETGDPGSVTYDPTMTPDKLAAQEVATKKAIYGTDKRAGDLVIDPKTGEGTFVQDYTFKEHWDNAIIDHPALKFSPAARLLYATGKNIAEFATGKGLLGFDRDVNDPSGEGPAGGASAGGNYGGNVNPLQEYAGREYKDQPYASSTPSGGDGGDSISSLITAPQTPYIATGNTPVSNSVVANWYYGLGQTSTNPGGFNLATEYAAAKTKVAQTLGTPSSYGWLAVNNSPFYNWLKTNSLDKGII